MRLSLFIFIGFFSANMAAQNIYVYADQELKFGEFYVSNDSPGTITVSNSGDWSSSGNVHLLSANHQPAVFTISTDNPVPFKVQIESLTLNLHNSSGKEMRVKPNTTEPRVYTLQAGYPIQMSIGGTLEISPQTQSTSGNYSGTVSLTVNIYNE